MTFLQSHNLPATACFVLRFLPSQPSGIAMSDLEKLLAPSSLDGPAPRDRTGAGGYATNHTINSLRSTGLIDGDKSRLFVAEAWQDALESANSDREILQIVRRALFASPGSKSSWKWRGENGWDKSGPNDFVRAMCWFLAQDPLGPPFAFGRKGSAADVERLQRQQLGGRVVVTNITRWADFERWACALGMARRIPLKNALFLSPDPTDAISEELADAVEPGKWYPINDVLDRLARQLPIVGPGILRSQMLEQLRAAPGGVGERTEDPTLSQAIIVLAQKQLLEFKALSDAAHQRLLWDRPAPQSITHLRLLEA